MAQTKKTRTMAGLAAATVVIAATGISAQSGALAAPGQAGSVSVLTEEAAALVAEFEDGIAARTSGGTVIPVTVSGGTVGATAKEFTALKVTAKIGGLLAKVAWVDATHLRVTAPVTPKATAVTMQLLVNGVAGPESTAKVGYSPTVITVTPAKINAAGGETVTITGQGFLGVDPDDSAAVKFGDAEATSFEVVSATRITAVAPAGDNGVAAVTVTTAGGESAAANGARVTYRAALGIDVSGEPVVKASGGPVVLTVTGAPLGDNATEFAAERVSARLGVKTLAATYVDDTHVKVTLPAIAAESAELTLVHDGIVGEPAEIALAPVVSSLSVKSDTTLGGAKVVVKVAGANIAGATDFKFGDDPATCVRQGTGTAVTFVCTAPPVSGVGPVWVSFTSAAGTPSRFTAAAMFSYTN
ncbi:IPT/TIG domain-containing protein [Actinoplanes sp. NBC_00393]|uniref:IPT/TIG domain-containing protein n=1 Tax=Actinoplanes sp. NBC_00393 TaxID=2975953 RepID=UPI002E1F131F